MAMAAMEGLTEELLGDIMRGMGRVSVPDERSRVHKNECSFCFDSPESEEGLFTNLATFQSCGRSHLELDHRRTGATLYLHQKWTKVPKEQEQGRKEAQPHKTQVTKLGIGVEGGFQVDQDPFEYSKANSLAVVSGGSGAGVTVRIVALPNPRLPDLVTISLQAVLERQDAAKQEEIQSWEEEYKVSKYAANLPQLANAVKIQPNAASWRCQAPDCDRAESNLWLNLSDGFIGCGRRNWDGTGGNGHALSHYEETGRKYPLSVKLGTITADGADVFSYAPDENDMVKDPKLSEHLEHWGINMMKMRKTEETVAELSINLNLVYEWDTIQESGEKLEPLCAPGYVGLENIGNSCYMNSLLQVLFSLPEFQHRYVQGAAQIFHKSPVVAAEDLQTQLGKIAVALCTDAYARAGLQQPRIAPRMFKAVIGRGHAEFSTGHQQDVLEFYQWLLGLIERAERQDKQSNLPRLFTFEVEERIRCSASGRVRYQRRSGDNFLPLGIPLEAATNHAELEQWERQQQQQAKSEEEAAAAKKARTGGEPIAIVPFEACMQSFAQTEQLHDFYSTATKKRGDAEKTTRLTTFPPYLFVQMRRYVLGPDWIPRKLNAKVHVPERLDLRHLRARGRQPGEELMPEDPSVAPAQRGQGAEPQALQPDESLVAQLMSMGFGENGCKRAAVATRNGPVETAMEWVFQHMGDPDFNDPLPTSSSQEEPVDAEKIATLTSFGFTAQQAKKALKACSANVERAADYLFSRAGELDNEEPAAESKEEAKTATLDGEGQYELIAFISHMGPNTGSGHYVCHIKKEGRWAIFNDSKVAVSKATPFDLGYLYLFRRIDHKPAV